MVLGSRPERLSPALRPVAVASLVVTLDACITNPDYIPPLVDASATGGETTTSTSDATATAATTTASSSTASTSASTTSTSTTQGPTATSSGYCGDGVVDPGESCDDGAKNGALDSECTITCALKEELCGDGVVDFGEECDDGNIDDGDGCSSICGFEPAPNVCGDGVIGDNEDCDDANNVEADGCEPDCTKTPPGVCGDGIKAWDELCDDANLMDNDGCQADCTPTPPAVCVDPDLLIQCDLGLDKGDPMAPFKAIGLGCSDDPMLGIPIAKPNMAVQDLTSWEIAGAFGKYTENNLPFYGAREGASMLILSTGHLLPPDMLGTVTLPYNSQAADPENGNVDDDSFLPGYMPSDDQSGTMQVQWQIGQNNPNDKIHLTFTTKVPSGATAYSLDIAVFSAEWPQFVNSVYDDPFVVWQVGDNYVGNVAVVDGKAITNTSLHPHWSKVPFDGVKDCATLGSDGPGFTCDEPPLAGTGFEGHAGTKWLRLNRKVTPGSVLELYFFLADMVDVQGATVVLIDRFRWRCDPCIDANDPACAGATPSLDCCGLSLPK